MSSANSLAVDCKLSGRSYMYIRKSNFPKIGPCESTDDQWEHWSLRTTRWNILLKKLLSRLRNFPDRRNFSLVARYSLKFTRCKITRYLLQNFFITRCRSCSLQKITRYSLQKLLVAKNHSLLVAKFAHYSLQKCSLQKITRHQQKN